MQHKLTPFIIATSLFLSIVLTQSLQSSEENGKLGPIDSITLAGSDGDITVKNSDERISWGEEKTSKVWSVGFMETGKALEQLMKADHFVEVRDELDEELEEGLKAARETLDEIMERGRSLEPDDPEGPALRQEWESAYRNFEQIQQAAIKTRGELAAEQMEESYNEVLEAVNVVSDRLNIDMVLRFIPPDSEFEGNSPDAAIMQIRLRTALRLPEGIDITDEVLSELGLEVE
ncbi:MAG TPA: OmpH family outer membrane protein [Phycisphaerales bacterium]|nr:OmpH family outer membrane protein [Phycisphaerales bacterium]